MFEERNCKINLNIINPSPTCEYITPHKQIKKEITPTESSMFI